MSIRDDMLRKGSRMLESDFWENYAIFVDFQRSVALFHHVTSDEWLLLILYDIER